VNLHDIASGAIGSVNPTVLVTLQHSTGSTTDDDGKRTPTYDTTTGVRAQVQALTFTDLHQIDGLNLNGTRRAIYLYGAVAATVRASGQGGDLITLPDGSVWLVAYVLEQWPDWCKVVCTLQDGS
jgi:hypothetical protein